MLTKDEIREREDMTEERVLVPEWKGEVRVCSMTSVQRDAWEQRCVSQGSGTTQQNIRGLKLELVMQTVRTEEGGLMFGPEDREWLQEKNAAAIERIFQVATRVCGLAEADIEALAENSSAGRNDDSGSDSP